MKDTRLFTRLCSIRDMYIRMRAVGEALGPDVEADELSRAVAQREQLLSEIAREQTHLERESSDWRSRCRTDSMVRTVVEEIRSLLYTITDRDVILQKMVGDQIGAIRTELFSLSSRSKAALAYAGHATAIPRG